MAKWKNRIVAYEPAVDPAQLLAHPLNARRHPGAQRDAMTDTLGDIGWADTVRVNVPGKGNQSVCPPATRTVPSSRSAAAWPLRALPRLEVADHVPVPGS